MMTTTIQIKFIIFLSFLATKGTHTTWSTLSHAKDIAADKNAAIGQRLSQLSSSEESEYLKPLGSLEMYSEHIDGLPDVDISYKESNERRKHGPGHGQVPPDESLSYPDRSFIESSSSAESSLKANTAIGGNGSIEGVPPMKNTAEYDGRSAGTLLDEFVSGKLGTADAANTLPIFLTEPESAFVVKNRPAVLKCKAAHALQLHFKCSGSSQPPPSVHDKHVDPHTGVHLEEVTATIHRDLVDEYFGKGPFKCDCHAWSSRGVVKSQAATVNIAYIRKQFTTSPTSLRVEVGSHADLHCDPPNGFPEPTVTWYKNNAPIGGGGSGSGSTAAVEQHGPTVTAQNTLTFQQVSLQDMANYTCSAENVAGKRTSDSAVLIVYVNGGWSSWSSWKECKCSGKPGQGRKRQRVCNNPMPLNGGAQCSGPQVQKSPDCMPCPEDTQIVSVDGFETTTNKRVGRWSSWGEWSVCSTECIQVRRRKCLTSVEEDIVVAGGHVLGMTEAGNGGNVGGAMTTTGNAKSSCIGKDIQTAECRGELCHIGKDDFDWTLYLGLAFITAVCFAFGAALICCARRGIGPNPHYSITRSVMDTDYMHGADKKEMRMHIEAVNVSYDYANPGNGNGFVPPSHRLTTSSAMSEHHYDVPNLPANYTNPIDNLSVGYLTDTPDTSTADTSNSGYNTATAPKIPALSSAKSLTICEPVTSAGGSLRLYNGDIILLIPELAIAKSQKKHISLVLLSDDGTRLSLPSTESMLICSTIVHCAPRNFGFQKPVILKIPHCLAEPDEWNVYIYHADNECDDLNVAWRKLVAVGEETINTPAYVHLEEEHVYIMTEYLGRFVVVADPKGPTGPGSLASIKMRLLAFSQHTPSSANCSLRIYIVKDFPNSRDVCTNIETKLGGTYMGESDAFPFYLNNRNLKIRIRSESDGSWDVASAEQSEQVIPYNHILSNNCILHCEFTLRLVDDLALRVNFMQCGGGGGGGDSRDDIVFHSFSISNNFKATLECNDLRPATVSIDGQGNYVNDIHAIGNAQLPRAMKRLICDALDPPRSDERDWRLLAKKLNTDRYIAYFATKPSPTEQLLNLCECRASTASHTVLQLLMALKEMDRQDVINIIAETFGPFWL